MDLKPTNTSIQAAPRSNTTWSHPAANAVLAATIRAGIHHLDHRPYMGVSVLSNVLFCFLLQIRSNECKSVCFIHSDKTQPSDHTLVKRSSRPAPPRPPP